MPPHRRCRSTGKNLNMAPFEKCCANACAAFEDDRTDAAMHEMRGCGKADWTGTDDSDGKIWTDHHVH